MGCRYACMCEGNCLDCGSYASEKYYGHAEDLLAQSHGYSSYEEWYRAKEYERFQKEEYEKVQME